MAALGYLTRIPVPATYYSEIDLKRSTRWFSWIGLLIGGIASMLLLLFTPLLGQTVAALLAMISSIIVTGGFHQDGLADTCDGFWGAWQRERKLQIMQDSQIGTYGVLALLSVFSLQASTLAALPIEAVATALLIAHSASRAVAGWLSATLPYARSISQGKTPQAADNPGRAHLLILSLAPLMALTLVDKGVALLLVVALVLCFIGMRRLLLRHIQGYTGDTLGAAQQVSETLCLLVILGWQ